MDIWPWFCADASSLTQVKKRWYIYRWALYRTGTAQGIAKIVQTLFAQFAMETLNSLRRNYMVIY